MNTKEIKESRMRQIEQLLAERPMTRADLGRAIGLKSSTLYNYVDSLYEEGRIYVSGWDIKPSVIAERFSAGDEDDVPPPPGWSRRAKTRVTSRARKSSGIRRDPLVAALFGAAA